MKTYIAGAKTAVLLGVVTFLTSCTYEDIVKIDYPEQLIYLPAAVNGLFTVSSITSAGTARYVIDLERKKMNIPLGVSRSGASLDGELSVNIKANTDTISKLISANTLVGTEGLTSEKYSLPASVNLPDGKNNVPFTLSIDLDFLRSNPTKKYAIAVSIASSQRKTTPNLGTVIISVDAAILKPNPNFTTKADATIPRKITFTNTSANSVSYSWDFGDGSAASTDVTPTYTYANAGTYTVTLTATGITGTADAIKKATTLTVP